MSRIDPRARQSFIMLMDITMVLVAVPISLLLSQSRLSFEPYSFEALLVWAGVVVLSHMLFRFAGFYNTVWRFASTPDFFNIISSCGVLSLCLYITAVTVRWFHPVTGLNERQFLVFFLVSFTLVSTPRLVYRYMREGAGWRLLASPRGEPGRKSALFAGTMAEADIIIRFAQSEGGNGTRVIGILAQEETAIVGSRLRGVPIVAKAPRLSGALEEYTTSTNQVDMLIIGHQETDLEETAELIRVARRKNVGVVQFSGFSHPGGVGAPILETVDMETILRRPTVAADEDRIRAFVSDRRVLVTGGAGSIGRTMVKRCLQLGAQSVLVADISEFGIFRLTDTMDDALLSRLQTSIVDVTDKQQMTRVTARFRPDIVFHAAALKHVPLLEENWLSAIKTNVFGTMACAEVAAQCGVKQFVAISSDKAADPTSVLGLTKLAAEKIVSALQASPRSGNASATVFNAVRFGNVFGSDGSVATIFERQALAGEPVTITDPSMTRYMMTIREAIDLVIIAASNAEAGAADEACGIYMLEMGKPVSILALAEAIIRLAGKRPYADVPIVVTGRRPGEKLHEVLVADGEKMLPTDMPGIATIQTGTISLLEIHDALAKLRKAIDDDDKAAAVRVMRSLNRTLPHVEIGVQDAV